MIDLLSVLLGMLLVYLIFSVAVSHLRELIAQRAGDRGRFLRLGVYRLVADDAIAARVLHHALINGLYKDPATRTAPPSYIEPSNFALALTHIVVRRGAPPTTTSAGGSDAYKVDAAMAPLTYESLRAALARFADQRSQLAIALLPIVDRAAGDMQAAQKGIEQWFAGGMDRVSGWYKSHARKQLFWLGLLVAAALNIDSIEIFRHLNRNPEDAARIAALAESLERTGKLADIDVKDLVGRTATTSEMGSLVRLVSDKSSFGTLPIGYACLSFAHEAVRRLDSSSPGSGNKERLGTPSASAGQPSTQGAARAATAPSPGCDEEVASLTKLSPQQWLLKLWGWILTAFAGSLGAAYWFAAISKVVNVRGTGPRPESSKST